MPLFSRLFTEFELMFDSLLLVCSRGREATENNIYFRCVQELNSVVLLDGRRPQLGLWRLAALCALIKFIFIAIIYVARSKSLGTFFLCQIEF